MWLPSHDVVLFLEWISLVDGENRPVNHEPRVSRGACVVLVVLKETAMF